MNDMNKSEVLNIINQLGIRPNKNLGQNFLINNKTASKMIIESQIKKNQSILEIGPGLGALTENLVKNPNQIYAYEIDTVLFYFLSKNFPDIKIYNFLMKIF